MSAQPKTRSYSELNYSQDNGKEYRRSPNNETTYIGAQSTGEADIFPVYTKPEQGTWKQEESFDTDLDYQHLEDRFLRLLPVKESPKQKKNVQLILRKHYVKKILADLQEIQSYCDDPGAAIFASNILQNIQRMRDENPDDPYLEILMALYDAMAYQNSWSEYNSEQYKEAHKVLKQCLEHENISEDRLEKSIIKLTKVGFRTLPFKLGL